MLVAYTHNTTVIDIVIHWTSCCGSRHQGKQGHQL